VDDKEVAEAGASGGRSDRGLLRTGGNEHEGVNVQFIKVKGHMDDHKGFIDKFRCAKGNHLADDYAKKGMQPETTQMPYKMEVLPQYISGETTTR